MVWYLNGVTKTGGAALSPAGPADTRWQAVALADCNGDGSTDIAWQFVATGDVSVWYMNGVTRTGGAATSPARVTPPWQVVAPR